MKGQAPNPMAPDLPLSIENENMMTTIFRIVLTIDENMNHIHKRIDKQEGHASSMRSNGNTENHHSQNEINEAMDQERRTKYSR